MDHVRRWLKAQMKKPKILVEPFGGGAGVSLISVNEKLVERAVFSEIDRDVAATWETVLNGHAAWLANDCCCLSRLVAVGGAIERERDLDSCVSAGRGDHGV